MRSREFVHPTEGTIRVKAELRDNHLKADVGGEQLEGPLLRTTNGAGLWRVGNASYRVVAAESQGKVWAAVNGRVYQFEMARDDEPAGSADSQNSIAAPMPGKVIKVLVTQGDSVEEGAAMIIVEAMKMEHTLRAPINGVVTAIHCEEGQSVDGNIALAEIEVKEGE